MDHLLFFHLICFNFKSFNNRHSFQSISDTMAAIGKKEMEAKMNSNCYSHNKSQASYILTISWIFLANGLGIYFFVEKPDQNVTFLKALDKPPNLLMIRRNMVFLVLFCFVFRNGKIIIKHIVLINQKRRLK